MNNQLLLPQNAIGRKYNAKMIHVGWVEQLITNEEIKNYKKYNNSDNFPKYFKKYGFYAYCHNCKEIVNAQHYYPNDNKTLGYYDEWFIPRDNSSDFYFSPLLLAKCPKCGQVEYVSDMKQTDIQYALYRSVFRDGNKLKIRQKSIEYKISKNKVYINYYLYVSVLNLDTGYTYFLPTWKNGKPIKRKGNNFKNSTYIAYGAGDDFQMSPYSDKCKDSDTVCLEAYNIIRDYKMEKLNCYIPTFEEQAINYTNKHKEKIGRSEFKLNMFAIKSFNRFPTINIYETKDGYLNDVCSGIKEVTKFRRKLSVNSLNPFNDAMLELNTKMPKSFKNYPFYFKMIACHSYNTLMKLNLKQANVIKLITSVAEDCFKNTNTFSLNTLINITSKYKYVVKMDNYNENSFINKIVKDMGTINRGILNDLFNQLEYVIEECPSYKVVLKGSIRDIHDNISSDVKKIRNRNKTIEYTKKELSISNLVTDNLSFNLAKDTHELIEVGSKMNICVGSYGNRAFNKDLYIVIARDHEGEPIMCIELSKNRLYTNQVKLKYNTHLFKDSPLVDDLFKWCAFANIIPISYDVKDDIKDSFYIQNSVLVNKIFNSLDNNDFDNLDAHNVIEEIIKRNDSRSSKIAV